MPARDRSVRRRAPAGTNKRLQALAFSSSSSSPSPLLDSLWLAGFALLIVRFGAASLSMLDHSTRKHMIKPKEGMAVQCPPNLCEIANNWRCGKKKLRFRCKPCSETKMWKNSGDWRPPTFCPSGCAVALGRQTAVRTSFCLPNGCACIVCRPKSRWCWSCACMTWTYARWPASVMCWRSSATGQGPAPCWRWGLICCIAEWPAPCWRWGLSGWVAEWPAICWRWELSACFVLRAFACCGHVTPKATACQESCRSHVLKSAMSGVCVCVVCVCVRVYVCVCVCVYVCVYAPGRCTTAYAIAVPCTAAFITRENLHQDVTSWNCVLCTVCATKSVRAQCVWHGTCSQI